MNVFRTLVAVCALALTAVAQDLPQRFTGTNPSPVQAEGTLEVHFENAALAFHSVEIEICHGADPLETETIMMDLDENGEGVKEFEVPSGWGSVVLSHPSSADKTIPVED